MSHAGPWNAFKEVLARAQRGEFDRAGEEEKAAAISELVRASSLTAAVLALQPFPGVDSAIVAPIHYRLVQAIGRIRGYRLDAREVLEVIEKLGGRLLVPHAAMAAAKLIPFVDVFAAPMAYALTCAVGELCDRYFGGGRAMGQREMKASFDVIYRDTYARAFKEKRDELRAIFRDRETRRRIGELKEERSKGTIRVEDVERRIDEILSGGSVDAPRR